jgi:hypothetical protein
MATSEISAESHSPERMFGVDSQRMNRAELNVALGTAVGSGRGRRRKRRRPRVVELALLLLLLLVSPVYGRNAAIRLGIAAACPSTVAIALFVCGSIQRKICPANSANNVDVKVGRTLCFHPSCKCMNDRLPRCEQVRTLQL